MQLFIQFPDFSNTTAIDKYIEKRLRTIHKRLESRHKNAVITLRGAVSGRNPDGKPKKFRAEIEVKVPRSKSPFFVKKTAMDFRSALSDAADAMESVLQRDSEKTERSRKTLGRSMRTIRSLKREGKI